MITFLLMVLMLLSMTHMAASQAIDQAYIDYHNPILNGATCDNATLQAAVTAIGTQEKTLYLTATDRNKVQCTWAINSSVTIPANIRLLVPFGVKAAIASNAILTVQGCVDADDPNWYSGGGSVTQVQRCGRDPGLWMGAAFRSYVETGCQHIESGGLLSKTIPSCRAWINLANGPTLEILDITQPHEVIYGPGDGTFILIARLDNTLQPGGWTCDGNKPYCWSLESAGLSDPDGTIRLGRSEIVAGSLTDFESLANRSPLDFTTVNNISYAMQFGMVCDGVADNSAALAAAYNSLPASGGGIILPASLNPCNFSRTFTITKSLILLGAGSTRGGPKTYRTVLQYTGSGTAIDINGLNSQGTRLVGFELGHTGTADYGIKINNTSSVRLDDIGIFPIAPMVPFTTAGILIGDDTVNNVHTVMIRDSFIRESAPVGILAVKVNEYMLVSESKILRHSSSNIALGRTAAAGGSASANDVHLLASTFENPIPGSSAIRINRAEAVWISDSHFEVGPPHADGTSTQALHIPSTAERASPISFLNNKVSTLAGATRSITINFISAFVRINGNYFFDGSGGTLTSHIINADAGRIILAENREVSISSRAKTFFVRNYTAAGAALTDGHFPDRLCQSATGAGSVGVGESTLAVCNMPENTLYENNQGLRIVAGGITLANANGKRIRAYIGAAPDPGIQIFDSGVVNADNDSWYLDCTGLRSTTLAIRITCKGRFHDTQTTEVIMSTAPVTLGWDGMRPITITGNGTVNNDVTLQWFSVHVLP